MTPYYTAFFLSLLSAACGDAPGPEWTGTVDTLANGTVAVRNSSEGAWTSEETWRLVEDQRIGSLEGGGPDVFGGLGDVITDERGRIFVVESQAEEVRVFDRDGVYVRTIGREGEGPGEFASAAGLMWGPRGHLWVWDSRNRRFTVYDTTGVFVEEHPHTEGSYVSGGHLFGPDGRLWVQHRIREADDERRFMVAMRVGASALEPVDTVPVPGMDEPERHTETQQTDDGVFIVMALAPPFQPNPTWRFRPPDRFWVSRLSTEYHLAEMDAEGDTVRVVDREHTPRPVTDAEVQALPEAARELGVPEVHPPFVDFRLGPGGRLWVERERVVADEGGASGSRPGVGDPGRAGASQGPAEETFWDLFDADGRYLGEVHLPEGVNGFDLRHVTEDAIYGRARGEFEESYLVRLAIRTGSGG